MKRRLVSVLLVLILCLSLLPATVRAAEPSVGEGYPEGLVMEGTVVTDYTGTATELIIPDGVTEIGRRAFSGNQTLERVTLPESVTTVGDYAFAYMYNLKSIDMPGVTSIGDSAFSCVNSQGNTSSLTTVSMPEVTEIGEEAFEYATALTVAELPEVRTIGVRAFFQCTSLTGITMPKAETIGDQAFGWTALTSFSVPDTVREVGDTILLATPLKSLSVSLNVLLNATFDEQSFDSIFSKNGEYEIILTGVDRDVTLLEDGIQADGKTVTFFVESSPYEPFHITSVAGATGGTVTNRTGKTVTVNGTEVLNGSVKPIGAESDNYLSVLALEGASLEPVFNNVTQAYTTFVDYTADTIRVQAVPSDSRADVTINGTAAAAADSYTVTVSLQEGENTISVVVTSPDGAAFKTYTVTVTKNPAPGSLVITTAQELMDFAAAVNNGDYAGVEDVIVELGGDIDMSGYDWTPAGIDGDHYFSGTFEGNGHTISNLTITKDTTGYFGLFGITDATIQNVNLTGSLTNTISDSGSAVGAIAGLITSGTIKNCTTDFTIISENHTLGVYVGGIAGGAVSSTLENCVSGTDLTGQLYGYAGGIAGTAETETKVINCTYSGTIVIGNQYIICGGIVGDIYGESGAPEIAYCVNYGLIDASMRTSPLNATLGGIAGDTAYAGRIHHCTNAGAVTGTANNIGGIIGNTGDGTVENCLNRGSVNSANGLYAGGIAGYVSESASVSTCVSAGSVTSETGTADPIAASAIDGATLEHNYYDNSLGFSGIATGTAADVNSGDFITEITALGGDYRLDADGKIEIIPMTYTLTVEGSEAETSGAGEYEAGEVVTIDAGSRSGYIFAGWTSSAGSFADPDSAQTTFTMPAESVTVTANWTEKTSSGSGGGPAAYPPDIKDTEHGEVGISPNQPVRGDTVVIRPVPDENYEVDEVIVTDGNGNEVEVTDNGDGTWSFVQPGSRVTIRVTFRETGGPSGCPQDETCPMYRFTDLNLSSWYHDGIHYCLENGLMTGMSAEIFAPEAVTTRAQIVTVLWFLENEPVVNYLMTFDDVADDAWYSEAIRWAAGEGIVNGYDNGSFGPDDTMTREQLATILYRYASVKGYDVTTVGVLSAFADAEDISDYAKDAFVWADAKGIVNGISATTLDPQGSATRAQVAALLMRFCQQYSVL